MPESLREVNEKIPLPPIGIEEIQRRAKEMIEREKRQFCPSSPASQHNAEVKGDGPDWTAAEEAFPRTPFPWHVLPVGVSESLQSLARSCATSPQPLPGIALCTLASTLGRTTSVSPKSSWAEPFIIWYADIRGSGDCKTPPANLMIRVIKETQASEYERFRKEDSAYRTLSKKERERTDPPAKPQGHFCTELTLEGLRDDLEDHPHGGLLVVQDELSSFITSQNQYKSGKGSDREAWLKLWDGNAARIVRVGRSIHITGARVSLFGGIQPGIFRRAFTGDDGIYLEDGTIFRFLLTYEPSAYHELTLESWDDTARQTWEMILHRAIRWASNRIAEQSSPLTMILDRESQDLFVHWRNSLEQRKGKMPESFRGFFPKAYSYALRLAGILHCLERFHEGLEPNRILGKSDITRGIETIEFYLGQTVSAMKLLESADFTAEQNGPQVVRLAQVLDSLRTDVDSGRLAIGFIQERFKRRSSGRTAHQNSPGHGGAASLSWTDNPLRPS